MPSLNNLNILNKTCQDIVIRDDQFLTHSYANTPLKSAISALQCGTFTSKKYAGQNDVSQRGIMTVNSKQSTSSLFGLVASIVDKHNWWTNDKWKHIAATILGPQSFCRTICKQKINHHEPTTHFFMNPPHIFGEPFLRTREPCLIPENKIAKHKRHVYKMIVKLQFQAAALYQTLCFCTQVLFQGHPFFLSLYFWLENKSIPRRQKKTTRCPFIFHKLSWVTNKPSSLSLNHPLNQAGDFHWGLPMFQLFQRGTGVGANQQSLSGSRCPSVEVAADFFSRRNTWKKGNDQITKLGESGVYIYIYVYVGML